MQLRKTLTGILSGVCILALILDGKTAMQGASEGIRICIRSVIPALFPFFILSNLLTGVLIGCESKLLRPLGRLFRIPPGAESLLIPAFLGGYPAGVQSIATVLRQGQLSQSDAQRMIAFCNNPGPSFLFGIIAPTLSLSKVWQLWGIQLISAWAVSACIPANNGTTGSIRGQAVTWTEAMNRSISVTGAVCGWVMLFRILIAFLEKWFLWLLPISAQAAVMGFLELTNGCIFLGRIPEHETQFILCSAMLSFGGLCVTMQTLSAAEGADISLYFPGKLLQTAVSMFLACLICPNHRRSAFLAIPFAAVFALILRKNENKCGNPATVGV